MSGLNRLAALANSVKDNDLSSDETADIAIVEEEGERPEVVVSEESHFDKLMSEMRLFLKENRHTSHLNLKLYEQQSVTPGELSARAIIYQGSLHAAWMVLSRGGSHRVYKTSLLRAIKRLPSAHFLAKEFEAYNLSGGIKKGKL